jgi:hypothetical protein
VLTNRTSHILLTLAGARERPQSSPLTYYRGRQDPGPCFTIRTSPSLGLNSLESQRFSPKGHTSGQHVPCPHSLSLKTPTRPRLRPRLAHLALTSIVSLREGTNRRAQSWQACDDQLSLSPLPEASRCTGSLDGRIWRRIYRLLARPNLPVSARVTKPSSGFLNQRRRSEGHLDALSVIGGFRFLPLRFYGDSRSAARLRM